MRKIFVSNIVSVDGYYAGLNKEFDWFTPNNQFFEYARAMMLEVGAIMYGRTTYQFMEAYWPHARENDPVITERMNNLHKIVFSKSLASADWGETTLLREIVHDEIAQLKQQPGGDIVILGSGEIVSALTTLGLIDEYRLIISPVILGNGQTLFKGVTRRVGLQLVQTNMLGNGIQLQYYVPEKI